MLGSGLIAIAYPEPPPEPEGGPAEETGGEAGPAASQADVWTRADVELWLKACFRAMPSTPIYAPRSDTNHMQSMDKNKPSATFDIAAFAATVLGRRSDECRAVLVWARTMAVREAGETSIAEFCREMGWNRRTFDRRRIRACDKIAVAKNNIQKT